MRLHANHIAVILIIFICASCTAYETFQENETTRTYIKNGYQLTPGAHWYDCSSWKAPLPPSSAPRQFEDKSMNLIIKERTPKNVE